MLFKLIRNIKKKFHKVDTNVQPMETNELREKEAQLFGEDAIYYQRLFEKWTVKEDWNLESEGIFILLGVDPEQGLDEDNTEQYHRYNDLLTHARQCVEQNLLKVLNKAEAQEDWKVTPVSLYQWASISRVELRQEFTHLMDFVTKMTAVPDTAFVSNKNSVSVDEEAIQLLEDKTTALGAALNVLFHRRDECLNSKGNLRMEKIAPLIQADLLKWFGEKEPSINQQGIDDLIRQYINHKD